MTGVGATKEDVSFELEVQEDEDDAVPEEGDVRTEVETKEPEEPSSPVEYIRHVVCPSDTLAGLLLRYSITLRELKRHNDFPRVRT